MTPKLEERLNRAKLLTAFTIMVIRIKTHLLINIIMYIRIIIFEIIRALRDWHTTSVHWTSCVHVKGVNMRKLDKITPGIDQTSNMKKSQLSRSGCANSNPKRNCNFDEKNSAVSNI
jgi:hypothetical protein